MTPIIQSIAEKKLIGKRLTMSFAENRTYELWRSFMPLRKEINNSTGNDLYSLQVYPPAFFNNFDPAVFFEKWALTEVTDFDSIPPEMEKFLLPAGLYAVFQYKGTAANAAGTFKSIFENWLPGSLYTLDTRPHFEVLGEKYKKDDPESEEELWIPVKQKTD